MICLKRLKNQDYLSFIPWINDKEVIRYSLSVFQELNSPDEIQKWFEKMLTDPTNSAWGIYLDNPNEIKQKLIGYAGICSISKTNQSGEFFLFIGDKKYWNQGIGQSVTRQIIQIGFDKLHLHRIMLTVFEKNSAAISAYEKVGFIKEGILRDAIYRNGIFHHKWIMSIIETDWNRV